MFGEIIVNDESIPACFQELFTNRTAGIRRDILQSRRFIRCGNYDDGMVHCAIALKNTNGTSDGRFFLADCHIDTNEVFAFLVDNGVNRNCRLPRLAVTDDQFTLAATHRDHGVDRDNASLNGGIHILPLNHTWRNTLNGAKAGRRNGTSSINWLTQSIDHTSNHRLPHWYRSNPSCAAHRHAFDNPPVISHYDHTDTVFFQVEGCPHNAIRKLYQFLRTYIRESVDTCNAVTCLHNRTDVTDIEFRLKPLYLPLQITRDLLDQVCHDSSTLNFVLRTRTRIRFYPGVCVIFCLCSLRPVVPR